MNEMLLIFSMGIVAGIVLGILMVHEWADFADCMFSTSIWSSMALAWIISVNKVRWGLCYEIDWKLVSRKSPSKWTFEPVGLIIIRGVVKRVECPTSGQAAVRWANVCRAGLRTYPPWNESNLLLPCSGKETLACHYSSPKCDFQRHLFVTYPLR